MTKNKRFKLVNGIKKGTHSRIWDNRKQHNQGIGDELWLGEVVDMLNEGVAIVKENEELKQCIDNMGGRLQGLWAHYNANRYEIWGRAVEDVAKELGFKIYKPGDAPISMSDLKKERINGVKKLNEIIYKNECNNKINALKKENEQLKQVNKKILDTINKKITEKGMDWYGAEDNSKEEKEANLQLNVLEEIRDELKKLNEDDKMRWSKKTENTVQDIDGEEYNIDEIVGALNHYQKSVDSSSKENYEMYCLIEEFCLNAKKMIFDKSKDEQIEKTIE